MKTVLLGITFIFCLFSLNAQNVSSTSSLTSGGLDAGTQGDGGTYYGYQAGKSVITGVGNCLIGNYAGFSNTSGNLNTFIGSAAGYNNTGSFNIFIGNSAGYDNVNGSNNVYMGYAVSEGNNGNDNTMIGTYSGGSGSGSSNTFLGHHSGESLYGSNNICIGKNTGIFGAGSNNIIMGYKKQNIEADNQLFIDNDNTSLPLIWGDFAANLLKFNGKVGIGLEGNEFPILAAGVDVNKYKLIVWGGILATEVRVTTDWADYVFNEDYKLMPLNDVESYIKKNGHLPNIPSAKEIEQEGIEIGNITKLQQEKIEELTLHLIEQNKKLDKQEKEISELKHLINSLLEKKN
jgi:hypothetical protein